MTQPESSDLRRGEVEKLIPARPEGPASFVQRLQGRFGSEVDPEISLQEDEAAAGEAAEPPPPSSHGSERSESHGLFLKLSEKDPAAHRYRIKGELARGGMGAILRVWDDDLRRNLAMKVLLSRSPGGESGGGEGKVDEELLSRFLEEAQITGQLDHPGIVPVHDLGIDARGRVYFTMRLVRGRDLKQILDLLAEAQEGWTLTKALHVTLKVCEAMAFAHSKGVVHRDLKPANIMVGRFGETYVMDWGLARVLGRRDSHDMRIKPADASALSLVRTARKQDQSSDPKSPLVTMDGDVIGTPSYMSPEQAEGRLEEVGPRSDVYSLGSILYQMLSGEAPYVKSGTQMTPHTVLLRALEGPPAPIHKLAPHVPGELVAICEKAMARAPADRYGSMLDLAADIEAFLEGRVVSAYEAGSLAEARKWVHRNAGMAAALAVALLLALGGIAGVIAVQVTKARELEQANSGLAEAKKRAEDKEADAVAATKKANQAADEADDQKELALKNADAARLSSYNSNIRAAEYSLRLREVGEAGALLERCDEDLRDWEWHHLALRFQGQLGEPINLTTPIRRIVLTPRGDRAVVLTDNGMLHVFDLGRSGISAALKGKDLLLRKQADVDISPDGAVLAVAGGRLGAVALLSAGVLAPGAAQEEGEERLFPPYELEPGDGGWLPPAGAEVPEIAGDPPPAVTGVAFGAAGDLLAVAYENGVVLLWDHAAREVVRVLRAHNGPVRALAWDGAGTLLATGGDDGVARVFDARTGEEAKSFAGHEGAVLSLALSSRGDLLATGADDGRVRLWNAGSGRLIGRHDEHAGPVRALAFQPGAGGACVVSGGDDGTLQVWEITHEQGRESLDESFKPDVHPLFGHDQAVETIAFLGDGTLFMTGGADGSLRTWDPDVGGPTTSLIDRRFTAPGADVRLAHVTAVDFHPQGVLCLTGHADGSIAIWDSWSGELVDVLRGTQHAITSATWSADGNSILSASIDKKAVLWDVVARKERKAFEGHKGWIRAAAMAPDGSFVVTASVDKTAKVWDTAIGKEKASLEGHGGWVNAVAITPDQRQVWTGSRDGWLRLFDLPADQQTSSAASAPSVLQATSAIEVHTEVWRIALSPSPEGDLLLAAGLSDGRLLVLDARSGKELAARQVTVNEPISAMDFNPTGTRLVVGSVDGLLRVFSARTGDQLLTLLGHTGDISGVSFSSDGSRLLSSSDNSNRGGATIAWGEREALVWESGNSVERRETWRRAADLRSKAAPTVAKLYSQLFLQKNVLAQLEQWPLPDDVRLAAKRLALVRADDPARLVEESWAVVRQSGATPRELEVAQDRVEAALGIDPGSRFGLTVLGAVQVRRGYFAQALLSLDSAARMGAGEPRDEVALQCFLALAHHSLGHGSETSACLGKLDRLVEMLGPQYGQESLAALIAEARGAAGAEAVGAPGGAQPAAGG